MTIRISDNPIDIIVDQGKSDDGSINATVEIITEDGTKNGGLGVLDLKDMPDTFKGHAGETIVVSAEEDSFIFTQLRPQYLTSLIDTFASYKGRANQALVIRPDESGITTVNISTAELKFFYELADVGTMLANGGKLLRLISDSNGDGVGIEYVLASDMLEDILEFPNGESIFSYTNANITVDRKGRIVAASSGSAATTNMLTELGVVYAIKNTTGEGLNLSSTGAMKNDQVVMKVDGYSYPTVNWPTFLYSSSMLKRRVTVTDSVPQNTTVDALPTFNIHAQDGRIVLTAIPLDAINPIRLELANNVEMQSAITSKVLSNTNVLKLGSTGDVQIDTSLMPNQKYTPASGNSVVTVDLATEILRQQLGGNLTGSSYVTQIDVSTIEFNTQFDVGSLLLIRANKYMLSHRIRLITPFDADCELWLGAFDQNPVQHPNITGAYGRYDTPTEIGASRTEVLIARTEDTQLKGMIYNPYVPTKNVYLGEYDTIADLETDHPSPAEGEWAEVGSNKVPYVYSTANGWLKNVGIGNMLLWIEFEY